uniref:Uncharacterized protein n=1 Tax=Cannabis sativa TaxID=3483 RepID=A0A803PC15_CANSA
MSEVVDHASYGFSGGGSMSVIVKCLGFYFGVVGVGIVGIRHESSMGFGKTQFIPSLKMHPMVTFLKTSPEVPNHAINLMNETI